MGFFDELEYKVSDQFDRAFDHSRLRRRSVDLPDGNYSGFIEEFRLHLGENNKIYLLIRMIVTDGDYVGCRISRWTHINFDNPKNTSYNIKTDLAVLKYDWKGIRSLGDERRWAQMIGRPVEFKVTHKTSKTNGRRYTNIWFNYCNTQPYSKEYLASFLGSEEEDTEEDPENNT